MQRPYAVVLHFRAAAMTLTCIDSLLAEGIDAVALVDNSEDGGASLQTLQPAIARWQANGLQLAVEHPAQNLGFSAGVNRGVALGRERFGARAALILNNDAQLGPGSLQCLQQTLRTLAAPGIVAARIGGAASLGGCAYYQRWFGLITAWPLPGSFRYLSGCCLLVAPALTQAPLFDEHFFFYGDDIELAWRLSQRGIAQVLDETAAVAHRGSASSRNGSYFYEYHLVRSHWLLAPRLARHAAERHALILGRLLSLPARALLRTLRQRSTLPLLALYAATRDAALKRDARVRPG